MTVPLHGWPALLPAVSTRARATPADVKAAEATMEDFWSKLTDEDKKAYHGMVCLGRCNADSIKLMDKLVRIVLNG